MSSKKKVFAVAITTVALTVGSIGIGQASSKSRVSKGTMTRIDASGIANPMKQGAHAAQLATILSSLVAKGTITQVQADAITATIAAAKAAGQANKPGHGLGLAKPDRAAIEALIAKTIGIDTATIKSRLAAGETLGAIAGAKKADLIAALVAEQTKRIDAAVASGTITAAQATTMKANLVAHITAAVDSVGGLTMSGKVGKHGNDGRQGRGGHRGSGMGQAPKIPSPALSPSAA
jgi:hypothetical protein